MHVVKFAAFAAVAATLGACASAPPPDYRAALLGPCENAGDKYPWVLKDLWADGDTYEPETRFNPDGVMVYAYNGGTYDNGRWTIDGAALHMDTNNHYADYDGAFDGTSGRGTMKNEPGNTGTWALERACKP